MSEPNVEQKREFNRLLKLARVFETSNSIQDALFFYKKCASIRAGDRKIEKKIRKLENEIKMIRQVKKEGGMDINKTPARHSSDEVTTSGLSGMSPNKKNVFEETGVIDLLESSEDESTPIKPEKKNKKSTRKKQVIDDDDDILLSSEKEDEEEFSSSRSKKNTRTPSKKKILDKDDIFEDLFSSSSLHKESAPLEPKDAGKTPSKKRIYDDSIDISTPQEDDTAVVKSISDKDVTDKALLDLNPSPAGNDTSTPPHGKSGESADSHSTNEENLNADDSIDPENSSLIMSPEESVPEINDVDVAIGSISTGDNIEHDEILSGNDSSTEYFDVTKVNPAELVNEHSSSSRQSDDSGSISGNSSYSNDGKDDIIEDDDDDDSSILRPVFSTELITSDPTKPDEGPEEQVPNYVEIGKLRIPAGLFEKLYDYQKEGVKWLWKLHNTMPSGGILCDDMGLGKTIQVSTFLIGLIRGKVIKKALIVVPLSVIHQWKDELSKWAPGVSVKIYHGSYNTGNPGLSSGVWITTYGMVLNRITKLTRRGLVWDYVVLDEGHTIKNYNALISQRVRMLNSKRRLVMTGTPITNNLQELWSLLDWACQGELLGDKRAFHTEFEDRIIRGSDKSASDFEKELGRKIAESLRALIEPHVLRREKKDYLEKSMASSQRSAAVVAKTPEKISVKKNDLVVWLTLTDIQLRVYREFLGSEEVKDIFNSSKSPLAAIGVLQKICCHPALLKETTKTIEKLDLSFLHERDLIVENSTKIIFLIALLRKLIEDGHRTLIFSRSTRMLDIIEECLDKARITSTRVDGTFKPEDRKSVISNFVEDESINCFLLTTQVGAVGLNLVAADRVVIFDPSWSTLDDQAVDRVYRIGQKRNVVIYRLITCGTVEEKIYRKQVFKQSLMRTAMENDAAYRYFTRQELRDLFNLESSEFSVTQRQLSDLHKGQRKSYSELDENIKFIERQENVFGVSDHDLLFSVKNGDVVVKEVKELEMYVSKAVNTITGKHEQDKGSTIENSIVIIDDDDDDDVDSNGGSSSVADKHESVVVSFEDGGRKRKGRMGVKEERKDVEDSFDEEEDEDPISDDSGDDMFYRSRREKGTNRRLSDVSVIDLVDDDEFTKSFEDEERSVNVVSGPPVKRVKRIVDDDDISDSDVDNRVKRTSTPPPKVRGKAVGPLKVRRLKCNLGPQEKSEFNNLLRKMNDLIYGGSEIEALETGLRMLSICDEDPVLHAVVVNLGNKLFNSL